jgi:hypothetical protein
VSSLRNVERKYASVATIISINKKQLVSHSLVVCSVTNNGSSSGNSSKNMKQ